jgi:SRSO17 transposase
MLASYRIEGDVNSIPRFDIERTDIEGFINELKVFHGKFKDCFYRVETKEKAFQYMVGQFSSLEKKNIESMALEVEGAEPRPMQRFITDAVWDEEKMLRNYHKMVAAEMGDTEGVVIFDESGFVKKGNDSAGVSRQYCGSLGKIENCQVGVFAAYASKRGYCLLDKHLFMPEKWFSEDYVARRKRCAVPEDVTFRTKPQLAGGKLTSIHQEGTIPFRYIVADAIYGNSPEFIQAAEGCSGKTYFVSISSDIRCWLKEPKVSTRKYQYRGKAHSKQVAENNPLSVKAIAKSTHKYFWFRRRVSEGTKGPIVYEFTKRQVTLCQDGLPAKSVWLVIKRTLGDNPTYYYYISNAPISTRLKTFVWLSGMRWAIEQCFEETKSELGMDHYEIRKYSGWNHHILMCMLAHFFLWHLMITLGQRAPAITLPQMRTLLEAVLPLRVFGIEDVIEKVRLTQKRNHLAFITHKNKQLKLSL